jgi:hypothetical protein
MKRDYRRSGRGRKRSSLAGSSGSLAILAMFTAMRHASSRVRLIARQAVRPGDYVGNRGKRGSERLALETTFMTDGVEKAGSLFGVMLFR